jgi:hyperosmotically inducible periplasmic protein
MNPKLLICITLCLTLLSGVMIAEKKAFTDDEIYDFVRRKLASDQIVKGGALEVEVHQGVVTLKGMVEQEKQKERAAKLAKKISGVKSVTNELQVGRKGAPK